MATTKQDLLAELSENHYDQIQAVLNKKENAQLVNTIDDDKLSILMLATLKAKPSVEFLTYIVSHPSFDITYSTSTKRSNISTIVNMAKIQLVETALKNPAFLLHGDELTYQLALRLLDETDTALTGAVAKDPNSKRTAFLLNKKQELIKIVSLIREASINQAINKADVAFVKTAVKTPGFLFNKTELTYTLANNKLEELKKNPRADVKALTEIVAILRDESLLYGLDNDDADLYERLAQAGAKPEEPLSNGRHIGFMLRDRIDKCPKLDKWFTERAMQAFSRVSKNPQNFLNNMAERNQVIQQDAEINGQKNKEKGSILASGMTRMAGMLGSMKK